MDLCNLFGDDCTWILIIAAVILIMLLCGDHGKNNCNTGCNTCCCHRACR